MRKPKKEKKCCQAISAIQFTCATALSLRVGCPEICKRQQHREQGPTTTVEYIFIAKKAKDFWPSEPKEEYSYEDIFIFKILTIKGRTFLISFKHLLKNLFIIFLKFIDNTLYFIGHYETGKFIDFKLPHIGIKNKLSLLWRNRQLILPTARV